MPAIQLVVCDMAGTTVADHGEVLAAFMGAARESGLEASEDDVRARMGHSKREVFAELAARQLGASGDGADQLTDRAYDAFRRILEDHYRSQPVAPVDGTIEMFAALRRQGVRIALTTGFYRAVTDIILDRLGWLDRNDSPVDVSICGDDVPAGRPAPYMIHEAMRRLRVYDVHAVAKIGDTEADLHAGHHAGCALNVGVLSGAAKRDELARAPHTHILDAAVAVLEFVGTRPKGRG